MSAGSSSLLIAGDGPYQVAVPRVRCSYSFPRNSFYGGSPVVAGLFSTAIVCALNLVV